MKKSISLTIILVILISIANSGFCQYSKLRLGTKMNNANGYTNEIVIYFIQGATNGKDEYDATAMWNTDLYTPNSYFIIHDNRLWLDGVPPLINNRLDIMGLQVNTSGSFTITASQITDFPRNTKIFLIDSVLHKKQDLITNPTYGPFNFNTTDNEFRFYLYFQLPSTEPYGIIYGKTFFDKNNNCKYDDKEIDIRNVKVMLYKNNEVFDIYYTNSSGYYFFDVPVSDNYVIKTDSSKYTGYNLNCSSSSIPIKTFPANYDFGYICGETSKQELYTYMEGWGFRPGDKGGIRLNIDNNSCSIFNAKAKIWCSTKNSTFTRFSPYGTITQDTIVWDLKDLDNSKTYTSWF